MNYGSIQGVQETIETFKDALDLLFLQGHIVGEIGIELLLSTGQKAHQFTVMQEHIGACCALKAGIVALRPREGSTINIGGI